jgi:hypothetical protein
MRSKKVSEAIEAFEDLDDAQTRWEELFSELSEKEEVELERRLFTKGITINDKQELQK